MKELEIYKNIGDVEAVHNASLRVEYERLVSISNMGILDLHNGIKKSRKDFKNDNEYAVYQYAQFVEAIRE